MMERVLGPLPEHMIRKARLVFLSCVGDIVAVEIYFSFSNVNILLEHTWIQHIQNIYAA